MRGRRIFDHVDPYLAPAMTDPPDGPDYDGPEECEHDFGVLNGRRWCCKCGADGGPAR